MLVLSRKAGERIAIGKDIVITIVRIGQDKVRIGISAPKDMNIVRSELQTTDGSREGHGSARIIQEEKT